MRMTPPGRLLTDRLRAEAGFTMIVAVGVMFVASLLLVAAFTATNSDVHLSNVDTKQKQAYYAALAGVQEYEYKLQSNPNYWQTCEGPKNSVPEESGQNYEVTVLPASTAPKGTITCNVANPFNTVIEAKGALANTFRIKATGYAGTEKRALIATFKVTGFLDFIYFTNFETLDPKLYRDQTLASNCAGKYYSQWNGSYECQVITFTTGDSVAGPMHTNDSASVTGEASFGREGHVPPDAVEINGGTYPSAGCGGSARYFTATKCYVKGPTLVAPESDTSLAAYAETADEFFGATKLVLNGATNTIAVTYYVKKESEYVEKKETIAWPSNGLIYVQHNGACAYKYEYANSDNSEEASEEKGCGNVYVKGTYSKSLTIAGENDLIINGEVYPTSVEGKLGSEPSGTATLGLIASGYVRVYHPCSGETDGPGTLTNPWIYAAILSTSHSFIVDNFGCGSELGKLHVYGAIAQNYRGAVGTTGGTGYIKDYKYDGRLATDEPPYFLQPLKAGWKVIRQTAPSGG